MEHVILVDEDDRPIGHMEKMLAHKLGKLHRALSVFIFNSEGQMLLQQRAHHKYHSPGLWTNTCCSHPRENEATEDAATRRLKEEMGMSAALSHAFHFIYRTEFENGLIEHELDHVFIGFTDEQPLLNPEEVAAWKYMDILELQRDVDSHPENYTSWFKICLPQVLEKIST
ncbi:MAG: isopentenyl-diphosphate Delta-isomerase [Bacteroidota bacterium]|jgi:isopentenyl-diphosphate delta-isomerase